MDENAAEEMYSGSGARRVTVSASLDCPFCDQFTAQHPLDLARHIRTAHHFTGNYGSSGTGDRFRHNPDASAFVETAAGGASGGVDASREGSPDQRTLDAASSESNSREGYMANRTSTRFAAQVLHNSL